MVPKPASSAPSPDARLTFKGMTNDAAGVRRAGLRGLWLGMVACASMMVAGNSFAQTTASPVVLPNTFSTVAGATSGSAFTTGKTCGTTTGTTPPLALDAYGDGCPATTALLGPDLQDGVHLDGQGNIYINDITNNFVGAAEVSLLRKVDAKSGYISTVMSSANAACTAATGSAAGANDSNGDGCVFASAKYAKERGIGIDPYGNYFLSGYSSGEVRILCNAVSPLCPIAAGVAQTYSSAQKQVGYSYRIAGCVATGAGFTLPAFSITSYSASGTSVTYVGSSASNPTFVVGASVTVGALSPANANYSGTGTVTAATATSFAITLSTATTVSTTTATGTAIPASNSVAPAAGDGYFASPFWNLPGDVTAWGTSNSSFNTTATITGTGGTCTAGTGTTTATEYQPRAVAADQYGNVFIHDGADLRIRVIVGPATYTLPNGTLLTNPLPAILQLYSAYSSVTAAQMYGRIYPMAGGFAAGAAGKTCGSSTTTTGTLALDAQSDGCPWYYSSGAVTNPSGLAIDQTVENGTTAANLVFVDSTDHQLRVVYMGPTVTASAATAAPLTYPMANAIAKNNTLTGLSINKGYVYVLAGGTSVSTVPTATPALGNTISMGSYSRIAVAPFGNLYLGYLNAAAANVAFYDLSTGYVRELINSAAPTTTTSNPIIGGTTATAYYCKPATIGDGTAAFSSAGAYSAATLQTNACFQGQGTGSSTLGVGADNYGNLYIADSELDTTGYGRSRIRKVLASQLLPTTLGSTASQVIHIHGANGTTAGATAIAASAVEGSDISIGTPTCATTADGGGTVDCLATATFTPSVPGLRTSDLVLTPVGSSVTTGSYPMDAVATGSALVSDPTSVATATTANIIGAGTTPKGLALDAALDAFTMDTTATKFTEVTAGGSTTQLAGTLPSNPTQISLDPSGNIWAAGTGNSTLTELPLTAGAYSASNTVTVAGLPTGCPAACTATTTAPQAVTFDQFGNMYIADKTSLSVLKVPAAAISGTALPAISASTPTTTPVSAIATGLTNPTSLAIDGSGNVYIGDPGAGAIYRVDAISGTKTTLIAANPVYVAADAGGNVYYQDGTTNKAVEIPVSSVSSGVFQSGNLTVTILTGLTTPSGIAVAGSGNLYSADSGAATVTRVSRNALTYNFGTVTYGNTGTSIGFDVTNVGNQAATGYAQTDSGEFPVVGTGTGGCGTIPSTSNALASGSACTATVNFTPANGTSAVTSAVTLLPTSTTGALNLSGTEAGATAPTTTTSVAGATTASYAASGTEDTFTITVAASNSGTLTSGTVNVSIDSGATTPYILNSSNQATVNVSGLIVGSHTINATFPSQSISAQSYGTSTSGNYSFSITQVAPTVTYTPATTSVSYSAPVGTTALNATASYGGSSVPGVFVYTANGNEINAATYLAQGSYTLGVTFYPTDSTDYSSGSTASGGTFTVTQASTTAGIGATQHLVASDGTGNYTSIQTALNSYTGNGGNVYIKPGTYNGFVTVVQPNTSLYGLGGVAQNVILTNEDGAFSSPYPANPIYGTTYAAAGNNGSQGDEGSATMVVARAAISGVNGGATYTPYNFYAENLSIINSYDTDSSNSTYNYYNGSICTTAGSPSNNQALFNSGNLCNSQALAIWITADQSVLNNIYTASLQDTIYAGAISGGSGYAARQYWFRGKVTGDVDYIFGDAAAVFDHSSIYSAYHGTATGTDTIEAQNKSKQTGSGGDYLSGYIMNSDVFTSQSSGMTAFYFGRPYGTYSTWVMLNSYIDQIVSAGYIEFSGDTNLPTSTYVEYNDHTYTDPSTNSNDILGVPYLGTGGSSGSGVIVNGTSVKRETTSTNPGTVEVASGGFQTTYPTLPNTTLSPAEAQQYYPINFLSTTVGSNPYNNGVTSWNPTTAIKTGVNNFVSGGITTASFGTSVTILMRPQVPGQGAIDNNGNAVTFTIPTGTYSLSDGGNVIASGTLDPSGAAYFTSSSLTAGPHTLTWTYGGDSNFTGSTSSTFTLTIGSVATTTTLSPSTQNITYGQSASITATVAATAGSYTPTGTVILTIDGTSTQNATLSSGVANFTVTGLTAGSHTFTAAYQGDSSAVASNTTSSVSASVGQATLTVTGACSNRLFNQPNVCGNASVSGYKYTDSASTVFTSTPGSTTTATRDSVVGTYPASPAYTLSTFGSTNYTVNAVNGNFAISGSTPQSIIFAALPNFQSGASYQLTARTTSGLGVTYSVTAGIATVSGTTLTVNAPGTVTVQASSATDATGDYAAATPVSQSFAAQ